MTRYKSKKNTKKEFCRTATTHRNVVNKVVRTLPYWLEHPMIIGQDLEQNGCPTSELTALGKTLLAKLKNENIEAFFPVQKMVIPYLIGQGFTFYSTRRPSDVCVSANTGSGKTLAYVLPVLHNIEHLTRCHMRFRVLVVLPTEQLALQVVRVFRVYGSVLGIDVGEAIGQTSFAQEQKSLMRPLKPWEIALLPEHTNGTIGGVSTNHHPTHVPRVHVVVATPDRLKDHIALTPDFNLAYLKYLIFDEADRLVSADGGQWLNSIVAKIQEQQVAAAEIRGCDDFLAALPCLGKSCRPVQYAHKLLFSATLSCDPEKLQALNLYDPILFTTRSSDPRLLHCRQKNIVRNITPVKDMSNGGPSASGFPSSLTQEYIVVDQQFQPLALHCLISNNSWARTLVFTNSKEAAHRLALLLSVLSDGSYKVAEFSSRLGRKQIKIVTYFRRGHLNVLVCTDSLARGMDFPNVDVVINYDKTHCYETYVHRVGRTARAGCRGLAITMLNNGQHVDRFKRMFACSGSQVIERAFDMSSLSSLENKYKDALSALKESLAAAKPQKKGRKDRDVVGLATKKRKLSSGDAPF